MGEKFLQSLREIKYNLNITGSSNISTQVSETCSVYRKIGFVSSKGGCIDLRPLVVLSETRLRGRIGNRGRVVLRSTGDSSGPGGVERRETDEGDVGS